MPPVFLYKASGSCRSGWPPCVFSAKGADITRSLGAAPQEPVCGKGASAESAIHFTRFRFIISVSSSQLDAVRQYVQMQQEHRRTRTFPDEYRELLRRHSVVFDEQYVWD